MLRITPSHSAQAAIEYHDAALARSDYYTQEVGVWGGKAAEMLGLKGVVTREQFVALAYNKHPVTGQRLTPRTNGERTVKERVWDSETKKFVEKELTVPNRIAGYDVYGDAPKSLSVYYELTKDPVVLELFKEAFNETLAMMEQEVATRIRGRDDAGVVHTDDSRLTGNAVWGLFIHHGSRPVNGRVDPHLHGHAYWSNLTWFDAWNGGKGRWQAFYMREVKADAPWFQAVLHAKLADKLEAHEFKLRRTDHSFELACVNDETIQKFSKRTRQIEEEARINDTKICARARALMKRSGMDFADAYAQVKSQIGAECRQKKSEAKFSPEEQLEDWKSQMTPEELACFSLEAVRAGASANINSVDAAKAIAMEELFEKVSVKRQSHAAAMLLRRGITQVTVDQAEKWSQSDAFIRVSDKLVTTAEVLAKEKEMASLAVETRGQREPLGRGRQWEILHVEQSVEQKAAINHILESRDGVTGIIGRAGTGKTTMLREAVKAVETFSGKQVYVFAPTSSAVETLRREGFSTADTVQNLEHSELVRSAVAGCVLAIDEAGLLSVKQACWIIKFAKENNSPLILIGDPMQHHSVERGDALRVLIQQDAIRTVTLTKVLRQVDPEYRAGIYDLSEGQALRGFDKLNELGAIIELTDEKERLSQIADKHLAALKEGKTSLIIAPIHAEGRAVANVVRQRMREEGLIHGEDYQVGVLADIGLGKAQKKDPIQYASGRIVEVTGKIGGFKIGEQWEVKRSAQDGILVVRNGTERILPLEKSDKFELYERRAIEVAAGDQLRASCNSAVNGQRIINNELVTVKAVNNESLVVRRERGSEEVSIPLTKFLHFDQGITVTSIASQSKTVDQMIGSAPVRTFSQVNQKQFYVDMSRAREAGCMFTDCAEALREEIARPGDRLSAIEIAVEMEREQTETIAQERSVECER